MLAVENICGRCRSGQLSVCCAVCSPQNSRSLFSTQSICLRSPFLKRILFPHYFGKNVISGLLPNSNHSECSEISVLRHVFQFNSVTPHRLMKILCLVSCFCRIDNICFLFAGKKDSMNNNDKWGRMKECSFCDILFIRLTHPSQSP